MSDLVLCERGHYGINREAWLSSIEPRSILYIVRWDGGSVTGGQIRTGRNAIRVLAWLGLCSSPFAREKGVDLICSGRFRII